MSHIDKQKQSIAKLKKRLNQTQDNRLEGEKSSISSRINQIRNDLKLM